MRINPLHYAFSIEPVMTMRIRLFVCFEYHDFRNSGYDLLPCY
jgi:hypothetical protein